MRDDAVLEPGGGLLVRAGGLGVRFLVSSERSDGRFALVEHPLQPNALASPMHTHSREDEFSFVLEGRVGVQIGERELVAEPGSVVFKPRGVPHAFWNAGSAPARLLEIISPGGFEQYFLELAALLVPGTRFDPAAMVALAERYGLSIDLGSVARLRDKHGLTTGRAPG